MTHQSSDIQWRDNGTPVSTRFDDPYYSLENGLAETRHVFLAGNHLPDRFTDGFRIAELGFGTGLSLLCAYDAFQRAARPGKLKFTSFEAFPMAAEARARALEPFPELDLSLFDGWDGLSPLTRPDLDVDIITGDARDTLPRWPHKADAWFLDGFSPAKNPELWGPDLLRDVARHTVPGGTFATYTAAGHVRRALSDAGFQVSRIPGFGRKRHMSIGVLA